MCLGLGLEKVILEKIVKVVFTVGPAEEVKEVRYADAGIEADVVIGAAPMKTLVAEEIVHLIRVSNAQMERLEGEVEEGLLGMIGIEIDDADDDVA